MRRLVWAAIVVTATISPLAAQGSTEELLEQAHEFYERLEVERALPLLRQIVSPNWPFEVTREQRVEAYKYLGACLTLAGKRDSAVLFFRAAIERDPFTELDPNLFTPAQLATFGEAQRRTFAVAVRSVEPARVDPRTARVRFTIVATHAALVDVKLSAVGAGPPRSLVQSTMDGVREITDRKSTRLNSSHANISYAVFCLKKKKDTRTDISSKRRRTIQLLRYGGAS